MSYYVIEGTFHVVGKEPDGDSVKFKAMNGENWEKLKGTYVDLTEKTYLAQLRMEAIDALETHYHGMHQPWKWATMARSSLLQQLQIKDIKWNEKETTVESAKDGTKGYILSNAVEPNHRPVSFVFMGEPDKEDGSSVNLSSKLLKKSLNYKLITEGLAYPTYYENFPSTIRKEINKAVDKAKKDKTGLWPYDKTNIGVSIKELESVTEDNIILPKLFRRIGDYIKKGGKPEGFIDHLHQDEDPVEILSTGKTTNLSEILTVEDGIVKLTEKIEDLSFKEKPTKTKPK